MLTDASVRLRPWQDDDLPTLTAMRNDIALQSQLLARARGSQREQVREWLQGFGERLERQLFIITELGSDQALGFVQVTNFDRLDGHADLGICLLGKARGRGLGGQAISLLANYLRDQWRVRKLNLRVRADNFGALRCYEKAGFRRCGLLRQHIFIDGVWQDVVLMESFLTDPC